MNINYTRSKSRNTLSGWEKFMELWSDVPSFIKFVLFSTIFFYIINFFTNYVTFALSDIPYFTIYYFQFWRLITSSFLTTKITNIILGFVVWVKDAIALEKSLGTFRYALVFITNSIFIHLIYCGIVYLLSLIKGLSGLLQKINQPTDIIKNKTYSSCGLWPIIISEMTLLCFNNPESNMKCIFRPCLIKAKYYPLFILCVYTVINLGIDFEILSGFLYGYLYFYLLQSRIKFSDEFIRKLENCFCLKIITRLSSFISVDNAGVNANNNVSITDSNYDNSVLKNSFSENSTNKYIPFSGKGAAVGSGSDSVEYTHVNSNNDSNAIEVEGV